MPIYESQMPAGQMEKTRKRQVCAECGSHLRIFFDSDRNERVLACWDYQRTHHEGIAKEYHEKDYNIITRREFMATEIGEQKTRALEKYVGVTSLTKIEAGEIIDTIWPQASKASPAEVYKAVSICAQYGLNPLMRHLYLIPIAGKFVTVLGIGANRLIASRKHSYSYIDDTPRLMSEDEQKKIFGKVDAAALCAITILKDTKTGAIGRGYGKWPLTKNVQGEDKGNSQANMAMIRSERQALDRLYPAELPDAPVIDEQFATSSVTATIEEPEENVEASPVPAEPTSTTQDGPMPQATTATSESAGKSEDTGKAKFKRDPKTIKDKMGFQKACHEDFALNNPVEICRELNVDALQLVNDWADAYAKIAAARG